MTYQTIVAIFEQADCANLVGEAAIAIGSVHRGHVIGVAAETVDPLPVYSPFDVPDAQLMAQLYEAAAKKRAELEASYQRTVGQSGIPNEWRVFRGTTGATSRSMVAATRAADLIVSAQPRAGFPSEFNDMLMESGRPVLFLPWVQKSFKPFTKAVVAWDGSREAARSAFDAIPFLKAVPKVEILSVVTGGAQDQQMPMIGADLAVALDRHGIKATINSVSPGGLTVGEVLENYMTDAGADLLVMGAYGHSRFRETMFGGVTRTLLESMTTATFMSR